MSLARINMENQVANYIYSSCKEHQTYGNMVTEGKDSHGVIMAYKIFVRNWPSLLILDITLLHKQQISTMKLFLD